jgi:hypothetical protein
LQSSASWRRVQRWYAGAQSNVVEATLVVRSERSRRTVVLMQLDRTGKTLLWRARSCR